MWTYGITYNVPIRHKYNTNKVFQSASKAEDVFSVLLVLKLVLQFGSSVSLLGLLDEDLDNYHLKELRCSTQCHTQMSMWIISRDVVFLILLMLGISFKFGISGLLHQVITTIADRIRVSTAGARRDDLVKLKRLFEPDDDDTLWKLQRSVKKGSIESDDEEILETGFNHDQGDSKNDGVAGIHSEDPFNIYDHLKRKKENDNAVQQSHENLKYPPGFTSNEVNEFNSNSLDKEKGEENEGK
ncbi:hypothetical protein Tco_0084399 [Tanacetum coccineum]